LAEELHMTVEQLGKNLHSYELKQWVAYFKIKEAERKREEKIAENKSKQSNQPQEKFSFG